MLRNHVIAVRIFLGGVTGCCPMADLLMNDGVVEHINWTDVKQREQFAQYINGYTLFYDERQKASVEEFFSD